MADNVTLDAGSGGATAAADDIGGVHYQRVKLSLGADGAATDALGGAGAVAAGVQRVTLASDDPGVALLTTIDADSSALVAQTLDYDTGGGTATQVILGLALPGNGGPVAGGTSTNPVQVGDAGGSLTIDNAHLTSLGGAIAGTEVQVDVVGALPAGTNAIGKLAANSGVDIGDVDVTSVVPGTSATNLGKAEDAGHNSGDTGVMALGVRVDSPNATVAAAGDYHYVATDLVGGVRTALYETDFAVLGTKHVKKYYTNSGAVTDGIVWSPAANTRWYVTDIFINVSAAATVTLEDDLSGGDSPVWKAELAANSGWSHQFQTPLFSGEDAADLLVTTSAGNVYIMVTGYEI